MIVMIGKNSMGNVLHVIQGPETTFWNEMHGSAAVDITQALNKMDSEKPVYLHISSCMSEHITASHIQALIRGGERYPFAPPTPIFMPATVLDAPTAEAHAVKPVKKQRAAKCSRCGNVDVKLVPELHPPVCYSCIKIDLGVSTRNKPAEQ
jgi:hypothetical protein